MPLKFSIQVNFINMQKIYLFYGDDLNSISNRIKDIAGNQDITLEKIELNKKEDLEKLFNTGSNLPLFLNMSLTQVYLNSKLLKIIEEDETNFISFIKNTSQYKTVIVVVYFEKFNKTVKDQIVESKFLKTLKKDLVLVEEEHAKLKSWQREQIKAKVNHFAHKYNLKFEPRALELFLECLKDKLDNLEKEIQKLYTYILPNGIVSEQTIKDLYMSTSSLDDLYKLLISSKKLSVNKIIIQLDKLKSPLYLIAALQNKIRQALLIKAYLESNNNLYKISKLTGIHSYQLEKNIAQLKDVSSDHLMKTLSKLSNLEYKTKTGLVSDKNVLNLLVLNLAT